MILHSLPAAGKLALDLGVCTAAGAAFLEYVQGVSALAAAIVAGLLGLVRLVDACITLYERRTVQKWLGKVKFTRKSDAA